VDAAAVAVPWHTRPAEPIKSE